MDKDLTRLVVKVMRYKKLIILGGALAGLLLVAVIAGLIMLAPIQQVKTASSNLAESATTFVQTNVGQNPEAGLLGQALMWGASTYVEMTLNEAAQGNHMAALSCFAAIGGPSPVDVLQNVKSRLNNQALSENIDALAERLKSTASTSGPPTRPCLQWFMNS